MNNKKLWLSAVAIVIVLLLILRPFSCTPLDPLAIVAKVTVVGEDGKPIEGAGTDLLTYKPIKNMALGRDVTQCPSNTKGKATLTGHWGDPSMGVLISASKPGYYASGMEVHPQNGQTTYWRPEVKLVLRKIKNPVPMYVKRGSLHINKNVSIFQNGAGYDLIKGDWIKPYGKGEIADFIFHVQRQETDAKNFSAEATLTFSNPDDGIMPYPLPKDMQSLFIFPYEAPRDGYRNQFTIGKILLEKGFWHYFRERNNGELKQSSLDENLHYIFRIRTVRDKDGKIVSAYYGKIKKEINFVMGWNAEGVAFLYYLNPDPTSRSLEFSPGKNLFKEGGYDGDSP